MPRHPSLLSINPPIINSSNPWATTKTDLSALYESPNVGAVTTRTSLLHGFGHDNQVHQYCFFDVNDGFAKPGESFSKGREDEKIVEGDVPQGMKNAKGYTSLNTLGYSPYTLDEYLSTIKDIYLLTASNGGITDHGLPCPKSKLFIVSVTGSPEDIVECYLKICNARSAHPEYLHLAMEINLSCPNIHDRPPPAYDMESLGEYLQAVRDVKHEILSAEGSQASSTQLGVYIPAIGIKTPPYTYSGQFETLGSVLAAFGSPCPVDFITATNTLGSSLILSPNPSSTTASYTPSLPSESGFGIGGLAGPALHPLALGNVASIRRILDKYESLKDNVSIIGIGGVGDAEGVRRMKYVGADIVGVGTALGVAGVGIFQNLVEGVV